MAFTVVPPRGSQIVQWRSLLRRGPSQRNQSFAGTELPRNQQVLFCGQYTISLIFLALLKVITIPAFCAVVILYYLLEERSLRNGAR